MSGLGELETLTLLAVLHLEDEAYGVSVRDEIERRTGRRLTRGAIYTVLKRLERKGFLNGELGDPLPTRGGRARRYLTVSAEGLAALRTTTREIDRMRDGLEGHLADA